MRKKSIGIVFILILALTVLSACGSGSGDGAKQLSIATGGTGGVYYPLGGEIANIIQKEAKITANAQVSNASVENMRLIKSGSVQLAFTQTDIATYATEGTLMFSEEGAMTNIRGIGTLYPETIQIVTLKNSGINSVEDLKGKKVSVGAPGSGTFGNAEQVLAIHGITMDDISASYLSFDESTDGLQDGNIDAAFITAGVPTGSVEGLGAVKDITIVSISDDKIAELIAKYPYYAESIVPEGTYKLEEDVKTVAVMAMLITSSEMDEETIYNVTKALYDNADKISHKKGEFIKAETALEGMGIELHPGAEKYFKEKGLK